jgi:hypothetical protein
MIDLTPSQDGNIWLLGWRPRHANAAGTEHGQEAEGRPRRLSTDEWAQRHEYILDIVNPSQSQLVARSTLGGTVAGGFLHGSRLYTYAEDEAGEAIIQIWQLDISSNSGNR